MGIIPTNVNENEHKRDEKSDTDIDLIGDYALAELREPPIKRRKLNYKDNLQKAIDASLAESEQHINEALVTIKQLIDSQKVVPINDRKFDRRLIVSWNGWSLR